MNMQVELTVRLTKLTHLLHPLCVADVVSLFAFPFQREISLG